MVKIKNKTKLKRCFKAFERGISQGYMANQMGITARRFRQIYSVYKKTRELPDIGKNIGRPKKDIDSQAKEIIIQKHEKYYLNALYLEKVIYAENNIESFEKPLKI